MKIEQPRTNSRDSVTRTGHVNDGVSRSAAKGGVPQTTDAVRLSGDLQLASRAIEAAGSAEDRSQVVDCVRALHERGQLDVDVDGLADRMIDALLHSHDDHT